jgi:uncharacterized membrane protein YfcA
MLFHIFLAVHILGGSIGLLSGTWNLVARKGSARHRAVGRVFVVAMLATGLSALVLATLRPNPFLFMVGVLTLYLVGTGRLRLKRPLTTLRPAPLDRAMTLAMGLAGVAFGALGAGQLFRGEPFGTVYLTFGLIGLLFVRRDVKDLRRQWGPNERTSAHLQRMVGAYIAALTAFLVVNAGYMPGSIPAVVYWLLPTAVLTPLIIKWSRRYTARSA